MCQRSRRMIWTTTTRGPSGQALASSSLPQTGLATRSCSLASPCSLTPQACPKTSTQQMLFGSRTCEHAAKLWRPAAADRSFSPPSSSSFVLQVPTKQAVHLRRTLQWSAPPRNCLAQLPRPMRRWYAVQRKCFSTMKTAKTHPQRAPSLRFVERAAGGVWTAKGFTCTLYWVPDTVCVVVDATTPTAPAQSGSAGCAFDPVRQTFNLISYRTTTAGTAINYKPVKVQVRSSADPWVRVRARRWSLQCPLQPIHSHSYKNVCAVSPGW